MNAATLPSLPFKAFTIAIVVGLLCSAVFAMRLTAATSRQSVSALGHPLPGEQFVATVEFGGLVSGVSSYGLVPAVLVIRLGAIEQSISLDGVTRVPEILNRALDAFQAQGVRCAASGSDSILFVLNPASPEVEVYCDDRTLTVVKGVTSL